jgi:hypothetical protein
MFTKECDSMFDRKYVSDDLLRLFQTIPAIRAVWEGGSAATGFLDEFSDLDLSIVCHDDAVESIFQTLENHLQKIYGIQRKLRIPEPAWHGFSQCFYQIEHVPALFYLDIAIIKLSLPDKFTEPDRHGNAVIWYDLDQCYQPRPSTPEAIEKRCKTAFRNATATDFLMKFEVKKALARHLFSEAFPAYYNYLMRNLVPLLNLKHRPAKVDFGVRYSYRDYPEADAHLVENALKACSLDVLTGMFHAIEQRFLELQEELAPRWRT